MEVRRKATDAFRMLDTVTHKKKHVKKEWILKCKLSMHQVGTSSALKVEPDLETLSNEHTRSDVCGK